MGIPIPAGYKLPPGTVEQSKAYLQKQTDSFGLFLSYDRIYYHYGHLVAKIKLCNKVLRVLGGFTGFGDLTRNEILDALHNRFDVPDYRLLKDGKPSVDKSVIDALYNDPNIGAELKEFLEIYKVMADCNGVLNNLKQFMKYPLTNLLDKDNERLICVTPEWNILSTSRFSSRNPNMQNLSRKLNDIFTAPKGWELVHSDTGQVEPRITYSAYIQDALIQRLITLYDDAYYGLLHFILMTPEEEAEARAGGNIEKHEVTAEMKDKRQRLKVLGLAGNYGSANLSAIDKELGPLYETKVVNHPLRKQWESEVKAQVRGGADHFYAYFGTPVYPGEGRASDGKYSSGQGWAGHLIRCGINNPIQTTAAELMHISILQARRTLLPGEHVAGWIHDAGLFYVPEDKVEERGPILQNLLAYDVEGWIPIRSDLQIGKVKSGYAEPVF